MNKIAKFEKVSFEQFKKDWTDNFKESQDIQNIYENIIMPKRATKGSAGYDFYLPASITLKPNQTLKIPTGIRSAMEPGWVLLLFPRSGLGFKYRLQLDNTVGVIDEDYYYAENQGHIIIKITNDSKDQKTLELKAKDGFCQGIFLPFGITEDDDSKDLRTGGFGSTSNSPINSELNGAIKL